ncbi:MAG: GTPase HflX, partial [Magnetococcales bacterium]|nr:GTPase HflX [Magnetococcales bacterium]
MHDTKPQPERAFLLQPQERRLSRERAEGLLDELMHLASGTGLEVVSSRISPVSRVHPGTYLGQGTVASLREQMEAEGIDVLVFNTGLSPVQQRNLERALKVKVVDRTGLILEIFAARARTREGRLQVELALLLYQQSRLVRSWTHLER